MKKSFYLFVSFLFGSVLVFLFSCAQKQENSDYRISSESETYTMEVTTDGTTDAETESCAHAHFEIQGYIDSACDAEGYSGDKICLDCGEIIEKGTAIEKKSHQLTHYEGKEATCTESGYSAYDVCVNCGYSTYEVIPALGHDWVHVDKKEASCGEDGHEAFDYCSCCMYSTTVTYIEKSGNHVLNDGNVIKESTCTEHGLIYYTCEVCHSPVIEELPLAAHSLIKHAGKEATCEEDGWKAYVTCRNCSYTTYEAIPKLDHDLIHYDGREATCTVSGYKAYDLCSRCGYSNYEIIPAKGHEYVRVEKKDATCTEDGYETYFYCKNCSYTTYETIPSLGHSFATVWSSDENCHYKICTHTGCDVVTEKENHTAVVTKEGTEATYLTGGTTDEIRCSVCNYLISPQQETAPLHYKVSFNGFNSTSYSDMDVYYGKENVELPEPSAGEKVFVGWYSPEKDILITSAKISQWKYEFSSENVILYAVYTDKTTANECSYEFYDDTLLTIHLSKKLDEGQIYPIYRVDSSLDDGSLSNLNSLNGTPVLVGFYYGNSSLTLTINRFVENTDHLTDGIYVVNSEKEVELDGPLVRTEDSYAGKTAVFFGDSVSAGARTSDANKSLGNVTADNYYVNPDQEEAAVDYSLGGGWAYQFALEHNLSEVYNYSISGSTTANNNLTIIASLQDEYAQFKADFPDVLVDYVFVEVSLNDLGTIPNRQTHYIYNEDHELKAEMNYLSYDNPIMNSNYAKIKDNGGFYLQDTMLGSIIYMIQALHEEYANARVVFILAPYRTDVSTASVATIETDIKTIFDAYQLTYINLWDTGFDASTYTDETLKAKYWEDKIHPTVQASIDFFYPAIKEALDS